MGKKLDDELAEAAGLDEENPYTPPEESNDDAGMAIPQKAGSGSSNKKNVGLVLALVAMVGAIVALFLFGIDDVQVYSMTLAKFDENKAKYADQRVRIEGELVPNSLKKRLEPPCEYRFRLRDGDARLDVRFPQCVVPEAFVDRGQPGVMVTAEGRMKDGHFEASNIMAKCASKYDPETHTIEGQEQAQAPARSE